MMNEITYLDRSIEDYIQACLKVMPVVVVTGARQTGKSTLVQNLKNGRRQFYTLDDYDVLFRAQRQPLSLLDQGLPVTIDEVQLEPRLLKYIKQIVDRKRTPGQFLLTGSANLLLMEKISESLAGRASYMTLRSFTYKESLGRGSGLWSDLLQTPDRDWLDLLKDQTTPKADWRLVAEKGGLPPAALHLKTKSERAIWFDGYERTYLQRDLQSLSAISSLPDFRWLMRLLSLRVGQIANQSQLSRSTGIPQPTIHRYINLLQASYMLIRLPAYSVRKSKRLVKSPRYYWGDTGLGLHLAGTEPQGPHLENIVLNSLLSWRDAGPTGADLFYWRTQTGQEVDFVVETADSLLPIEVKATTKPCFGDSQNLQVFRQQQPQSRFGLLLHAGSDVRWLTPEILAAPWWQF